jgi:hypothetical protein
MKRRVWSRVAAQVAVASVLVVPLLFNAGLSASAASFSALTLENGWTNGPFGTSQAAVADDNGIVSFSGAISTSGSNDQPFTLPAPFRPETNVFVKADLCTAVNGRLEIEPSGTVLVEQDQEEASGFSAAECFTSLDGISFAQTPKGFTNLTLENGWTSAPFATSAPAAKLISGVVHLKGAISNSASSPNNVPFTLPAKFRPAATVYVPVDMCNGTNGRLQITPDGTVTVQQEASGLSDASCFTSLDGATYVLTGLKPLTLKHGWTGGPFSTGTPAVKVDNGIVRFAGAIATSGSNARPFTLKPAMRPTNAVFVPVDLCDATSGRLEIDPDGTVTVEQQASGFADAQCFVSLDGVSYDL